MRVSVERNNDNVVQIKKMYDDSKIPTRGSADAAGYDLYAHLGCDSVTIAPSETVKIKTGVAMSIPKGTFGAVFARSGLATKKGLRPANAVGVCDSDYRGEIIVALHNDSKEFQTIEDGERIAQYVVIPYLPVTFNVVDDLDTTDRGDGGFGSTGTK